MKKKILKRLREEAKNMPIPRSNDITGKQVITWKSNYRRLKREHKLRSEKSE